MMFYGELNNNSINKKQKEVSHGSTTRGFPKREKK